MRLQAVRFWVRRLRAMRADRAAALGEVWKAGHIDGCGDWQRCVAEGHLERNPYKRRS